MSCYGLLSYGTSPVILHVRCSSHMLALRAGVYPVTLEVVESMGRVVDTLFARSQKLAAV